MKRKTIKDLNKLLLGRKGGETTIKIIDKLLEHPYNINQLSDMLNLDYKTIAYHIGLTVEANFVVQEDMNYGRLYYPAPKLINNLKEYNEIKRYLRNMKRD